MGLGRMTIPVEIIRKTKAVDSDGFKTETSETVASVRCSREGRHGSLRWTNLAAFSDATDLFVTRKIPNVEVGYFILCGCEEFLITSVEDIKGRGMYVEILAKKVTPTHGEV